MTENPFTQMIGTLRGASWPAIPPIQVKAIAKTETSKSEQLRQLIRLQGPISPNALAVQIDLEGGSGLVRALLKSDFDANRVIARDGKYLWNPQYDEELERELNTAIKLLRRHGYQIKRPEGGPQWQTKGDAS